MKPAASDIVTPGRLMEADYAMGSEELAPRLLGCTLVRITKSGARLAGRIVETEAYIGVKDKAAHSFGGRRTDRNESMYGPPGACYVYFTYGMHHCVNVVCGAVGEPVAVLLRAVEPIEGLDIMLRNRASERRQSPIRVSDLCSGPGKLCQAFEIDRALNGANLCRDERIYIEPRREPVSNAEVVRSPRIGVAYAGEWASRPLRFHVANSPHVSRK